MFYILNEKIHIPHLVVGNQSKHLVGLGQLQRIDAFCPHTFFRLKQTEIAAQGTHVKWTVVHFSSAPTHFRRKFEPGLRRRGHCMDARNARLVLPLPHPLVAQRPLSPSLHTQHLRSCRHRCRFPLPAAWTLPRPPPRIHTLPPPPCRIGCPLLPALLASFRCHCSTSTTMPPPRLRRHLPSSKLAGLAPRPPPLQQACYL